MVYSRFVYPIIHPIILCIVDFGIYIVIPNIYFKDEETEVQKDWVTFPVSHRYASQAEGETFFAFHFLVIERDWMLFLWLGIFIPFIHCNLDNSPRIPKRRKSRYSDPILKLKQTFLPQYVNTDERKVEGVSHWYWCFYIHHFNIF